MNAAELTQHPVRALDCARCFARLFSFSSDHAEMQYTPLPSEHWAELIEAWMCHAPETLTDTIAQQYGGQAFQPSHHRQVLVGQHYLILDSHHASPGAVHIRDQVSELSPLFLLHFLARILSPCPTWTPRNCTLSWPPSHKPFPNRAGCGDTKVQK